MVQVPDSPCPVNLKHLQCVSSFTIVDLVNHPGGTYSVTIFKYITYLKAYNIFLMVTKEANIKK